MPHIEKIKQKREKGRFAKDTTCIICGGSGKLHVRDGIKPPFRVQTIPCPHCHPPGIKS